jgi:hypothetical protein
LQHPEEVQTAANEALSQGFRITVRSGGHCYEGFVSNRLDAAEKLAIIDVGEMKGMDHDAAGKSNHLMTRMVTAISSVLPPAIKTGMATFHYTDKQEKPFRVALAIRLVLVATSAAVVMACCPVCMA